MELYHPTDEAAERDEALTYLMNTYGDNVIKLCCMYLKDPVLAQDAAQDTFVKAYRFMDSYLGQEALSEKAWLMRIAVNTCKDMLKSNWFRRVDKHPDMTAFCKENAFLSPQDRTLFDTILRLPRPQKEAILLYYYQGMSIEDIACALHLSKSTVHKRLQKAKERLRNELERWYYDEA